jgi:hypothetical protein
MKRWLGIAAALVGVVIWWAVSRHLEFAEMVSPRAPDPATGETVAVNWKGTIVYMTQSDARLETLMFIAVVAIVAAVFVPRLFKYLRGKS